MTRRSVVFGFSICIYLEFTKFVYLTQNVLVTKTTDEAFSRFLTIWMLNEMSNSVRTLLEGPMAMVNIGVAEL